ncbi:head-tail joining protein [Bradyrhizobium sp. S3.7.6]
MGVDFSKLVLAPAMATFAKPVTVTPVVSQPNAAPYTARGIWTIQNTQILGESGNIYSTVNIKLGIRLADFPATAPGQGDKITTLASDLPLGLLDGALDPTITYIDFLLDDVTPDGQGGLSLSLKRVIS